VSVVTFDGLSLRAAPGRVMTPRATSERLVAAAVARLAGRAGRAADVGTGSGAIAIALARACPDAKVWATDTSLDAVELARENVRRHGLGGRVFVRHCDLLDDVPDDLDIVAANLPYLPATEVRAHPELAGEPFDAVFAPGDGLGPSRRLVSAAASHLAASGTLLLQLRGRVVVATPALDSPRTGVWDRAGVGPHGSRAGVGRGARTRARAPA
jgi:release factor glutamine methyltransferase